MDPMIFEMGITAYESLEPSTKELLLNPTAKTLGKSLNAVATVLCSPLLLLGSLTDAKIKKFSDEISKRINDIPEEYRDSSKSSLILQEIEAARYHISQEDLRQMYVTLIASTADSRKNQHVNPRMPIALSQLDKDTVLFLADVYNQSGHTIPLGQLKVKFSDGGDATVLQKMCIKEDDSIITDVGSRADILTSLGVLELSHTRHLVGENSERQYGILFDNLKLQKKISELPIHEDYHLDIAGSYLKITDFGENLCQCILA